MSRHRQVDPVSWSLQGEGFLVSALALTLRCKVVSFLALPAYLAKGRTQLLPLCVVLSAAVRAALRQLRGCVQGVNSCSLWGAICKNIQKILIFVKHH